MQTTVYQVTNNTTERNRKTTEIERVSVGYIALTFSFY